MTQDGEAHRRRALRLLGRTPRNPAPVLLSDLQKSLWIAQRLDPESRAYTSVLALEILGPVDAAQWCAALERVIERMPFLNAIYPEAGDGSPVLGAADAPFTIPIEAAQVPKGADLAQLATARVGGAFDLTRARAVRAQFTTCTPERAVLWLAAHHIAWDGCTLGKLLALWEEELGTNPTPLAGAAMTPNPLSKQSVSALRAQAEALYATADPTAEMALAPDTAGHTAFHICDVPPDLLHRIKGGAQKSGASLNSVFLAGLAGMAGLEGLSGLPVTLLVQDRTTAGFGLHRVLVPLPDIAQHGLSKLSTLIQVRMHEVIGLTALPEADQRAAFRAATGQLEVPLGRLLFSFDREALPPDRLAGVPVRFHVATPQTARAPLGLSLLMPKGSGNAKLRVEAANSAHGPQDAADFARRYLETLSTLTADPERPVAKLLRTRMSARRRLVRALHGANLGSLTLVTDLMERLEANPCAMIEGAHQYTGVDLCQARDAWAKRLAAVGVGEGDRVILALPRGLDSAAALLALWHLGAAPILADPDTTAGAIVESLHSAAASAGIAEQRAALVGAFQPARFVWLTPHQAQQVAGPCPPAVAPKATRPAYLIMTSGSTGVPALVEISHGNLAATLAAAHGFSEMPKQPRTVWSARLAFDISVLELFLPLTLGGTVVVHSPDPPDIETLARQAADADIFHAVPAVMAQVLETDTARAAGPRLALVGGDRVPRDLLARMRASWRDSALRILYGPSETTIIVLSEPVMEVPGSAVIGQPHPGVHLRIVDAEGRSVPPGITGELWIGGPMTARYYDNAQVRADRFVMRGGKRYFRSGDLVRLNAEDRIVFLGRSDSQEKIDGVRVDLEAIERLLRRQPGVAEAVVTGYHSALGRRRLAAFFVGASDIPAPEPSTLGQALAAHLPRAAVPAKITPLARIPLNRNGKIDRRALRQLAEIGAEGGGGTGKPMTELQETVAAAAQEVLGQEITEVDQNLLGLGADSIALARINRTLGTMTGKTAPLAKLMALPTVAGIAAALVAPSEAPETKATRLETAPATQQQQLLFQIEALLPAAPQATIPAAFEVSPHLPFGTLRRAFLNALAACDGFGLALRSGTTGLQLERLMPDVLEERAEIEEITLPDTAAAKAPLNGFFARRFDLEQGPPVRLLSLKVGPRQILALSAHHIVADEWALRLFFERLLSEVLAGPCVRLPPERSYLAYARQQAHNRDREAQAYLRHLDQTGGQPMGLFHPTTDKDRPDFIADRAVRHLPGFGPPLDALAARLSVTPVSIGLTAFAITMADVLRVSVPRIALMCANRDAPGTADLVGLTANTLLIDPLSGDANTDRETAIRATQCRLAQSLAFQSVQVRSLIEQVKMQGRDPAAYAVRIQFSYTDTSHLEIETENLRLSSLPEPDNWQPKGPTFRLTGYDIELNIQRNGADIRLVATYLTDALTHKSVTAILDGVTAHLNLMTGHGH